MGSSGVWFLLPPPHRWVIRWAPPRKGMMLVEALSLNGRQVVLATCTRVIAEHQSSLDKGSCGLYRWSEDSWAPGYGDNDFYLIGWTLRFDICWMGQKGFLMCINTKQKERMSCSFNTEPESPALISLYGKVVSCRIYHTSSLGGEDWFQVPLFFLLWIETLSTTRIPLHVGLWVSGHRWKGDVVLISLVRLVHHTWLCWLCLLAPTRDLLRSCKWNLKFGQSLWLESQGRVTSF